MVNYYLPYKIIVLINDFLGINYWTNRKKLTLINLFIDYKYSDWYYNIKNKLLWHNWNIKHNPDYNINFKLNIIPQRFNRLYFINKSFVNEINIYDFIIYKRIFGIYFLDFQNSDYFEKELKKLYFKYYKLVYL